MSLNLTPNMILCSYREKKENFKIIKNMSETEINKTITKTLSGIRAETGERVTNQIVLPNSNSTKRNTNRKSKFAEDKLKKIGSDTVRSVRKMRNCASVNVQLKSQRKVIRFLRTSQEVDESIKEKIVVPVINKIIEIAKAEFDGGVELLDKTVKLLTAPTGVGKTYALYTYFIPLFSAITGNRLSIILIPDNSIMGEDEVDKIRETGIPNLSKEDVLEMNFDYAEKLVKNNSGEKRVVVLRDSKANLNPKSVLNKLKTSPTKNIVILTTFKNFTTRTVPRRKDDPSNKPKSLTKGEVFANALKEGNIKFSLFIDEVHISTTSSLDNYIENMGLTTPVYDAVFSGIIADIIQYNPYVFGMTATNTREQTGDLTIDENTNGNKLKYEFLSECTIGKELLVPRTGWVGTFNYYDPGISDEEFVKNHAHPFLDKFNDLIDRLKAYGVNDVSRIIRMIFRTKQASPNSEGKDDHRAKFRETLWAMRMVANYENFHGRGDKRSISVMNGKVKLWLTPNQVLSIKNWTKDINKFPENEVDDDTIIGNMRSEYEPDAKYLFVIGKGVVGMDIPPLKFLCDLRTNDKDEGEIVIGDSVEQVNGRLMRLNVGYDLRGVDGDHPDFKNWLLNGYDTTDYVRKYMTEEEFEIFRMVNTMHVLAPSIDTYTDPVHGVEVKLRKKFSEEEDAIEWFKFQKSDG